MHKDILYLGSQSPSRKALLESAGFKVELLRHLSDETLPEGQGALDCAAMVKAIAIAKMDALDKTPLLDVSEGQRLYLVTADTLTQDRQTGEIFGKPKDRDDADRMLDREYLVDIFTGTCVRAYSRSGEHFSQLFEKSWSTVTTTEFFVPRSYRNFYFSLMPQALYACGAGVVEGAGFLFLKSVQGSFTSVIGISLYELRLVLEEAGFCFV